MAVTYIALPLTPKQPTKLTFDIRVCMPVHPRTHPTDDRQYRSVNRSLTHSVANAFLGIMKCILNSDGHIVVMEV